MEKNFGEKVDVHVHIVHTDKKDVSVSVWPEVLPAKCTGCAITYLSHVMIYYT